MLDINLIRQNPEKVKEALKKKLWDADFDEFLKWDDERKEKLKFVENNKAEMNRLSASVPQLKKAGEDVTKIFAKVKEIAAKKARAALALRKISANEIIIGADTVVVYNDKLLGKPLDDKDAENMLLSLSGKKHFVYTGVSLIYTNKEGALSELSFAEKTEVCFAEISLSDIKKYISTGNHRDKAGSYAIQDEFSVHVKGINGDYNNVVGFPVSRIYQELAKIT